VRVRQFELRLLAVGLTVLWTVGGGIVLLAYRPGGPIDLLVGVAASLPLFLGAAAIAWPPLVKSDRGSAGVFWLGLGAGLLLLPSIGGIVGQLVTGGARQLLPSLEVVYPWALALLATALFAGLGISRRLISEIGVGRKRLAASLAFALVATSLIGGTFAGVTLADQAALADQPAAASRFGPTSAGLTPPDCNAAITRADSAKLALDVWADVDGRSVGTVSLSGIRSGDDFSWTAQVVRGSDLYVQYSAARRGSSAWLMTPDRAWAQVDPASVDADTVDAAALAGVLSPGNRATAENLGLEHVEGARGRHCRVAVDGSTFESSFLQAEWLIGTAHPTTWRGELDYWIFGDGEVGLIQGSVNGDAQDILPHGLLVTVHVRMTATDRDSAIAVPTPRL